MPEEGLVLDPVEVATPDRGELDLHAADDSILVRFEGVDWPVFDPELFMVQRAVGERAIDSRLPNRTVSVPLMIGTRGDFSASRHALEAKVARINEEGGWARRTLKDGKKLFADVEKATLKFGGEIDQAILDLDANVQLTIEVSEFYGEAVETIPVKSTSGEARVTVPLVDGNLPARTSLIVKDEAAANHLGLKYACRYKPADAATTAALSYLATALVPLDTAAKTSLGGTVSGEGVGHTSLSTDWTPVLGTGFLTHQGIFRVEARVLTTSEVPPEGRFVYDVGDLIAPAELDPVAIPGKTSGPTNRFYILDFGEITLEPNPVGLHRWQGAFQFRGAAGGENVYIDRVRFWPIGQGSGILNAVSKPSRGLATFKARDEFNQKKGALNGQALPTGSTWTTVSAGGDADFEVNGAGAVVRATKSDVVGRTAEAPGGAYSSGVHRLGFMWSALPTAESQLRSTCRFLGTCVCQAEYSITGGKTISRLSLSTLLDSAVVDYPWQAGVHYTLWGMMVNNKFAAVWVTAEGAEPIGDPDLILPMSTASAAASFSDVYTGTQAITRTYTDFATWVPNIDAVLFANQSVEITNEGCYRASSDGLGFGKIEPIGDLPRLPVSGDEQREVEIMIATSPGDFDQVPDVGFQNFSVQTLTHPSRLFVP